MKGIPREKFATAPFLGGVLLLLCALIFYYLAVLKIDYHKTALLNLGPHTDAVEYFAQAKAMLKDGWPSIQIGYDKSPSRYPFGYPALMLPWLKILPERESILAPFRTNQTLGLFLLLAVFGFYAYLAVPLTGGFAAVLLATLPAFFTFCRSSLSEISGLALIVPAFMFAYLGLKEERRWKIYLSAVFLGLSLNIRLQFLFFAPLLLAMALFPRKGMRLCWFFHCAALPIVFTLAASPVLLMNTIQFHSPLKTGYDFWILQNEWFGQHPLLSLDYVPTNIASLWREFALRPNGYFAANIFGTGTSFVPAFILLVLAGVTFIRISRFIACASLASLSFLAAALCHQFGADRRFYLPVLTLLVAVAALAVTWAAKNLLVRRRTIAASAILILFAAACLGYPSRSGYNTVASNRSQAWDALHFTDAPWRSTEFAAQKHFVELSSSHPCIVLSDIDPVYLNALLPDSFIAAPVDGKHSYRFSKIWRYGRPEALALVKHGLDQSLPVYALFVSQEELNEQAARLPQIDGYEWVAAENPTPTTEAVTLKLSPSSR